MTKVGLAGATSSAVLILALAGCEAQKSENPFSPSVAGPIPGVNITAPKLIEPAQGFKYKESAAADQAGDRERDLQRRAADDVHVRGCDRLDLHDQGVRAERRSPGRRRPHQRTDRSPRSRSRLLLAREGRRRRQFQPVLVVAVRAAAQAAAESSGAGLTGEQRSRDVASADADGQRFRPQCGHRRRVLRIPDCDRSGVHESGRVRLLPRESGADDVHSRGRSRRRSAALLARARGRRRDHERVGGNPDLPDAECGAESRPITGSRPSDGRTVRLEQRPGDRQLHRGEVSASIWRREFRSVSVRRT